jgi:3-hydroxyacyl-CoA dehydrogenase
MDVVLNKLKELYAKYNMEMCKLSPLLEEYVSKGWLSKKTGGVLLDEFRTYRGAD